MAAKKKLTKLVPMGNNGRKQGAPKARVANQPGSVNMRRARRNPRHEHA